MIVYLNGGFGVGKTTVAELLVAELQPTILFDPETVGTILNETLSRVDPRSDFQDFAIWAELVQSFLLALRRSYPATTIVVPMSVLDAARRADVVARLRDVDAATYDFTLVADPGELRRRIVARRLTERSREWCARHPDAAPTASSFADSVTIETTRLTPQEVAASILATIETI